MAAGLCLAALPAMAATTPPPPDTKPTIVLPETGTQTTEYNPVQGFPDHNGDFSAMLIVIPQAEMAEFDRDDGGNRQLSRVSRAEAGAVLAVKLVFTGLAADSNGNGEVTYDLKVLGPDGQIYSGSDYRHLAAVRGPVGDGRQVYDNRSQVVLMQFEPQDAPGVYSIQAVARDEVAELELPLATTIELLPAGTVGQASPPQIESSSTPAILPPSSAMAPIPDPVVKASPVKKKKKYRRKKRH